MPISLMRTDDGGTTVREDGVLIGYVDDDKTTLYGINNSGHAVKIGTVDHSSEIVGKIKEWQKTQDTKEMDI